jgi:carbon monoxide dehydrogenase subunit G
MEFQNSFTVNAPLQRVWEFLLNVQEVAPCMPGATLNEVVGDNEFKGTVKVKLGAVQMSYAGTATIQSIDEANHEVVLVATGRETRGTGNASTTTTSRLFADGPNRTRVDLTSEVNISGRVAQFGRGIMQDVASRLIGEFARNLEARLTTDDSPDIGSAAPDPQESPSVIESVSPAAVGAGEVASVAPHPDTTPRPVPEPNASEPVATTPPITATPPPAPPVPRRPGPPPAEPAPIKILPILADVARSQIATGLRRLAAIVEPRDRQ